MDNPTLTDLNTRGLVFVRLDTIKKSATIDIRKKKALALVFPTWNLLRNPGSGKRSLLFLEPGADASVGLAAMRTFCLFTDSFFCFVIGAAGGSNANPADDFTIVFGGVLFSAFAADFAASFVIGAADCSSADPVSDFTIVFTGVFAGIFNVGAAGGNDVSFCGSFSCVLMVGFAVVFACGAADGSRTGAGPGAAPCAGVWPGEGTAVSIPTGQMAAEHRGQNRTSSGHVSPQFLQIMAYLPALR